VWDCSTTTAPIPIPDPASLLFFLYRRLFDLTYREQDNYPSLRRPKDIVATFLSSALFTLVLSLTSNVRNFQDVSNIFCFSCSCIHYRTNCLSFALHILCTSHSWIIFQCTSISKTWEIWSFSFWRIKSSWMLHRVDCEKVTEDSWKLVLSSDGTSSPRTGSPRWLLDWAAFLRSDGNHLRIETAYIPEGFNKLLG
jgi:hypothetical protein